MPRISLKFTYLVILLLCSSNISWAKSKQTTNFNPRHATLIMDSQTGAILHQENATKHRYPASLTKMMTVYMAFDAIKKGELKMEQQLKISQNAATRPKTNLGLKAGQTMMVKDAILACIIKSANDAAVVLGEAIGGSEENFAKKMTLKAHQLGMHHSFFRNASGLHHVQQRTTAHDMAKLGIALKRDFPERYSLFAQTSFSYKGVIYNSHNNVLKNFPGATGLKTGYVDASGFNLVTSANRGNTNLIGVVMGGSTASSRDQKMIKLLNRYFTNTSNIAKVQLTAHNATTKPPVTKNKNNKPRLKFSKASSYKKLALNAS